MNLGVQNIVFQFPPKSADVYFINLKDQESKLFGLKTLKHFLQQDGTPSSLLIN